MAVFFACKGRITAEKIKGDIYGWKRLQWIRGGSGNGKATHDNREKTVLITSADGKTKVRLTEYNGVLYKHSQAEAGRYDTMDEMPGHTLKELVANAKANGATIEKISSKQLEAESKRNIENSRKQAQELSGRSSRRGVNRHRAYWSAM